MDQLNADPSYRERVAANEAVRNRHWAALGLAERPIVEALNAVGVDVPSVFHLADAKKLIPAAIPVLFEHLRHDYPDQIREIMLRILGRPQLMPRWHELVEIFEHNTLNLSPDIRYVAAVALMEAGDDTVIDDVIRLVKDQSLGDDRAPLLLSLHRSKNPRAKMTLMELRDDPTLGKEVKRMRRLARRGPITKL